MKKFLQKRSRNTDRVAELHIKISTIEVAKNTTFETEKAQTRDFCVDGNALTRLPGMEERD